MYEKERNPPSRTKKKERRRNPPLPCSCAAEDSPVLSLSSKMLIKRNHGFSD
ncbi:hypothetical protein ACE6H2_025296 [Prunus campanulata]